MQFVCGYCTVCCVIVFCMSFACCSVLITRFRFLLFILCLFYCFICFVFYFLCSMFLCIVFPHVYNCFFSICAQVY